MNVDSIGIIACQVFVVYVISVYLSLIGARIVNAKPASIGKIDFDHCFIPIANSGICVLLVIYFPCMWIKKLFVWAFRGPLESVADCYFDCRKRFYIYKA